MLELIWDGKYDANGRGHTPLRLTPLPNSGNNQHQRATAAKALDLFGANRSAEWRNRLIWRD